jgi:photosystem II stability/assembly factor-like uncharacterized protein
VRGLRIGFGLLCLVALAAVFASAGWRETDSGGAQADPDKGTMQAQPPTPRTTKTSPDAYFRAEAQAQQLQGGPALAWSSRGPSPITGGHGPTAPGGETTPPWSGRGTSIAVDPADDTTAYLGTSDGGVWKTTDDGAHWSPIFDAQSTLAIGAIAIDPSNNQRVYVGTGEANWQLDTGEVLLGDGIYRSTDGGSTWSRAPIPFASGYMGGGCGVSSLVVDPADTTILVAAVYCPGTTDSSTTALIRSTDGGASWTPVGPAVGGSEDDTPFVTLDRADSTGQTWYATLAATGGLGGIWKSTDAGATWTQVFNSIPDPSEYGTWSAPRGVIAVSPTNGNRVYALFGSTFACTGAGCLYCGAAACGDATNAPQLLVSDDAGATWKQIENPDGDGSTPPYGESDALFLCGGAQCSSTLAMTVSPTDPSVVYAGSLNPAKLTVTVPADPNQSPTSTLSIPQAPIHADERAFEFDSAGRLWVANDGGIYRFPSESTMDTSVDDLNANLSTVQIYRLSVDTAGDILIATQDVGCDLYRPASGWKQLGWGLERFGCGDSSAAVISTVHPGAMYAELQYDMWIVRSLDGGQTIDNIQLLGPCGNYTHFCAPFMDPLVEDPSTGDLLYGADGEVWRSTNPNAADYTAVTSSQVSPQFDWYPGAIATGGAGGNTIYVGSSNWSNVTNQMGIEVTHDGGGTDPSHWTLGGGCCGTAPVSDIEVDPSNASHAYATSTSWPPQSPRAGLSANGAVSGVYETTDGGVHWQNITGDLPAAPYNAVAVDWGFSKQTIYVATDVGVFWSENDGTIWHASSSGLPAVSVQDLQIQTVNGTKKLYAATFGRGVYSTPTVSTVLQTLSASTTGTGNGSVTSSPAGIDCGTTCAYDFNNGAAVTLTEHTAPGSTFTGWSGDCTGTATTCQLTMSGAHTATATFVVNPVLTVAKDGDGSGTVTSDPSGLSCGSTCTKDFAPGTPVTLTATAAPGSTFTGWSGDCSGTGATCQLQMDTDHTATATFRANPELTVTTAGTGSGSVTSAPAGVDCGATCTFAFSFGTPVELTATPADGSTFTGWSGDCSGTITTCELTMNAPHAATATFTANPPPPVHCVVPKLVGKKLAAARTALQKAHCALGKVTKKRSTKKKGIVIRQSARRGTTKPEGYRVNVTVSKGRH